MKKFVQLIVLVMSFGMAQLAFSANEHGTPEEAQSMVKAFISFMKEHGKEQALAEVNTRKGRFVDRDLYITVFDMTGKNLAHGANPKLVGKSLAELRDVNGKFYMRERLDLLKTKDSGWSNYTWPNPVTKALEEKTTYFEKYEDVFVNCGAYKK